jgi:hypothetical protein
MVTLVISGLEDGDKLIASLTYLASRLRKAHVVTKLEHRFVPRDRMEIHRVQKRAIQVEDCGFCQFDILHCVSFTDIAVSGLRWRRTGSKTFGEINDNVPRPRLGRQCDFSPRWRVRVMGPGKIASFCGSQ